MAEDAIRSTLIINAAPDAVFAVLADPAQHAAIDGTGWVSEAVDAERLATVGQTFEMAMYHPRHPDGNYRTVNRVRDFERPSVISWQTGYRAEDGTLRFGGWV